MTKLRCVGRGWGRVVGSLQSPFYKMAPVPLFAASTEPASYTGEGNLRFATLGSERVEAGGDND